MGIFDNIEARIGIRNEFNEETNLPWEDEQNHPSVDYVLWLEGEKIRLEKQLSSVEKQMSNKM